MGATTQALAGSRALPMFINRENKHLVGLALFTVAAALYLCCNHFHLVPPQMLPRSWIDLSVPFLPGTVWVYISEYLFFSAVYLACNDELTLNKYFYSFLCLQTISCFIFWAWPTTYPRDLFPLPNDLDPVTRYVFGSLRQTDTPASCCPSLHVSSVYLSTFLFLEGQKKYFPLFFMWGTAIALSTLTTKQHYMIDVVTGFMLAVIHYWIFFRRVNYRPLALQANR
jgi:membrane-associated phospholipid phosphatase